jgi:predicted aspartyl protease
LRDTYAKLKIYGPNGVEELNGLVDTGATFTKIPLDVGEKLGLRVSRRVAVRLSDERSVERDLCYAEAEVDGVKDLIRITLGAGSEEPLIGYTTLEILGFKINPITRRLENTTPIGY